MIRWVSGGLIVLGVLGAGARGAFAEDPRASKGSNLDRLDDPKVVRRLSGAETAPSAAPAVPGTAGPAPAVGASRAPSGAPAVGGRAPSGAPAVGGRAPSGAPAEGASRTSAAPAVGAGGPSVSVPPAAPSVATQPSNLGSSAGAPVVPLPASAPVADPSSANAAAASSANASSPPVVGGAEAGSAGVVAARAEPPVAEAWPFAPRAEVSWRYLPLFRPGAQQGGQATGKVSDEAFSVLTARVFPTSSLLRFGLALDFGWEDGRFAVNGDYFVAETTSFGIQHLGRVTPFVEALGGGGYMRRLQTGVSVPSAVWFFGGEGGADFYVASRLYVHASLGYVRVVNGLAQISGFTLLHEDTWTFRLGFGI